MSKSFRRFRCNSWRRDRSYLDPLPQIADFFRKNNAISESSAVEMTQLNWGSLGGEMDPVKGATIHNKIQPWKK